MIIDFVPTGYWDSNYCETEESNLNVYNPLVFSETTTSLVLRIDGYVVNAADVTDDLPRAVLISLFSWRRANPDDDLPSSIKNGWWGDTFSPIKNDKIGSRIWLLARAKLSQETVTLAEEYANEALQWLVDDGIADSVQVVAERRSNNGLALHIKITRGDKSLLNIRFINVWDYLNAF